MSGRRDGFTLLEILVVVVIIGMLMALIVPRIGERFEIARVQIARMGVETLSTELELYKLDNGLYPSTGQGLRALVTEPVGEPRPRQYPARGYAKPESLIDPWKNPYNYDRPGAHNPTTYDVSSLANDGQPGGEGYAEDIGNWEASAQR